MPIFSSLATGGYFVVTDDTETDCPVPPVTTKLSWRKLSVFNVTRVHRGAKWPNIFSFCALKDNKGFGVTLIYRIISYFQMATKCVCILSSLSGLYLCRRYVYIDGLVQERRSALLMHWVFLALTHR